LLIGHFLLADWSFGTRPPSVTVSEIFDGECDTMADMTLNDLIICPIAIA